MFLALLKPNLEKHHFLVLVLTQWWTILLIKSSNYRAQSWVVTLLQSISELHIRTPLEPFHNSYKVSFAKISFSILAFFVCSEFTQCLLSLFSVYSFTVLIHTPVFWQPSQLRISSISSCLHTSLIPDFRACISNSFSTFFVEKDSWNVLHWNGIQVCSVIQKKMTW